MNARHGETGGVQRVGYGHERAHVLGEVREAAVGQPVADGGAVRLARPVHEDDAGARAAHEPPVAAHRSVALQVLQLAVAGLDDERAHGDEARKARCPVAMTVSVTRRLAPPPLSSRRTSSRSAGSRSPACSGHSTMAMPVFERQVEAKLLQLGRRAQPIKVEMRHRHARRRVALHQREGRARDLLALVAGERMDDGTGERRLAGAELAAQREAGRRVAR